MLAQIILRKELSKPFYHSAVHSVSKTLIGATLSVVLSSVLFSSVGYAATELSDHALSHATEANPSQGDIPDVLDCPDNMNDAQCTRLQYEHYARQTEQSYKEFLRNETTNPLRNKVIKQPLLTQPLKNPSNPPISEPKLNFDNLSINTPQSIKTP